MKRNNTNSSVKLFVRVLMFCSALCAFFSVVFLVVTFKNDELPKINNSNLGIIIKAVNENFKTSLLFSAIPFFGSLSAIFFVFSFVKDLNNPLFLKMIIFSYIGLFPMFFILSLILLATKPSDTTIVFTIFSYIGASILYISALYSKFKSS
ncbi:hypothetical protein AABD41_14965 [Staphylococcus pseudoxylosus]|uniref:hypothetical protein n=1 Tax=Staphylococcus pseudoxylosus TaxID=2282419 RepID=UPI00398B618F